MAAIFFSGNIVIDAILTGHYALDCRHEHKSNQQHSEKKSTMIKKVLVLLMVSTAWAAPLRPEVPIVKRFHEAMTDTDRETIPEVMTTETRETENEDDYVDLFGSSTPKPEVSDTTTPPPFWTSENEGDQVDMVLKREIFTLYKIVYPAVLLVWTGITVLCLLGVPILVLLCIMQSHATRVVEEMEKKAKDNEEEKGQQPFESSEEWQRMLPEDD